MVFHLKLAMKNILDALKWRYATKKFDDTVLLSNDKVSTLCQSFNLTATSYGLQPISLVVISDKELQKKLTQHSYNQKQVEQASHVLVICINTTINAETIEDYFALVKQERNTPDEVLSPFKSFLIDTFDKMEESSITTWATNQAYLALGTLLTACALEEVDACPMEGFNPKGYNEVLGLTEKGLSATLVLPVGKRANDDMFAGMKKVRKAEADIIYTV